MKKVIGNAALIDARKLTPETARTAPEIRNAAVILVSERSKELLGQLRIRNVASVLCIPEETTMLTINGEGTLSADTLAQKQAFILANGKLFIGPDVSPEAIVQRVAGGVVNGKLFCSVSQLAALQSCGIQINGKAEAFPDGCRLRGGNSPITAMEASALAEDEHLFLCKRALIESGALDILSERGVRLYGAGIMVYASDAPKVGACWQGDPSRIRPIKDGHRVLIGKQRINRRNAPTFRGALDIQGDVIIDADVEASMLQGLKSLRVEGELWLPMALMQRMLDTVDGDVEWVPYDGELIQCDDVLTLTGDMVANWPEKVTLSNDGVMEIAGDIDAEALKKHVALLHNAGKLTLSGAQHGALRMVMMNTGVIEESRPAEGEQDAGTAGEEEVLGNAAWLVL